MLLLTFSSDKERALGVVNFLLTHIQLTNKAGHIVVFVVQGKKITGKSRLVVDDEAISSLQTSKLHSCSKQSVSFIQ